MVSLVFKSSNMEPRQSLSSKPCDPEQDGGALATAPSCELLVGSSPSTENVVSWFSGKVFRKERLMMVEPGRLFYFGIPRNVEPQVHEMLQPIFSHIKREDHCERYGFLHTVRALVRRCGYDGIGECSGSLSMYVSHFPCISCIAIVCQFIRYFPAIRLDVDYDNMWKTRFAHGRAQCGTAAWNIFDVQEGAVPGRALTTCSSSGS